MQFTQFTKHTVGQETVIHKCFQRMPHIGTVFPFNMYFAIEVAHSTLTRYTGSRDRAPNFQNKSRRSLCFWRLNGTMTRNQDRKKQNKYFKDQNNHLLLELELRYHLVQNAHFISEKN